MAFSTEFIEGGRAILFRGTGIVTGSEIIAAKQALEANPETLRRAAFALVIFEEEKELRVTPDEVRQMARIDESLANFAPGVAVAVIAAKDHSFGVARMWETAIEPTGWRTAVFRSRLDADAWLREMLTSPM